MEGNEVKDSYEFIQFRVGFSRNLIFLRFLRIQGHNGAGAGGSANGDPVVNRIFGFQSNFDVQLTFRIDHLDVRPVIAVNAPNSHSVTGGGGSLADHGLLLFIDGAPDDNPSENLQFRGDGFLPLVSASKSIMENTDYNVRLVYRFGILSATVWLAMDPEPSAPDLILAIETPFGQRLALGANIADTTTRTVYYDNLIVR